MQTLDARMELNLLEVLAKSYGEGFVKAVEGMEAKPQIKKDDSRLLKEDVARMTRPIQDYNKALAGKVDEIVRDSFAAGKDDMEVAKILRSRIPEILNNEPITIQRPGKRPVTFTAEEYADMVANVVPYAVRNEGYIRGLKEAGADGWQSVAVGDERMCPMCGEKHGQVYGWDDPKPPYHVSCRCRPVAYFRKKTKEEMAESERIKAWAEEKPWETPGTPAESPDEVAEALIDDIIPKKMAYPGSKIERPKIVKNIIDIDKSETVIKFSEYQVPVGSSSDQYLEGLASESGFDALPISVTSTELDKIVSEGHRELFRGVGKKEYAEQFLSGKYFGGKGVDGNGIYTGFGDRGLPTAKNYAQGGGVVMRMAIDKGSDIRSIDDIYNSIKVESEQLKSEIDELKSKHVKASTDVIKKDIESKIRHLTAKQRMIRDPGRYAVINGIDAIEVPDLDHLIVLNRGVLYVSKEFL